MKFRVQNSYYYGTPPGLQEAKIPQLCVRLCEGTSKCRIRWACSYFALQRSVHQLPWPSLVDKTVEAAVCAIGELLCFKGTLWNMSASPRSPPAPRPRGWRRCPARRRLLAGGSNETKHTINNVRMVVKQNELQKKSWQRGDHQKHPSSRTPSHDSYATKKGCVCTLTRGFGEECCGGGHLLSRCMDALTVRHLKHMRKYCVFF